MDQRRRLIQELKKIRARAAEIGRELERLDQQQQPPNLPGRPNLHLVH